MSTLPMNEDDVLKRVLDEAHWAGWIVAHFRPARVMRRGRETYETPIAADGRGFPDLVLAHESRGIAFVELKGDRGRPTMQQTFWLCRLRAAARGQSRVRVSLVGPAELESFCAWLRGESDAS